MAVLFGADDILSRRTGAGEKEPVILAGVWKTTGRDFASEDDFLHSLDELRELALACGMKPLATVTQQLPGIDKAL